jgi:hypothetical protein
LDYDRDFSNQHHLEQELKVAIFHLVVEITGLLGIEVSL